MKDIKGFEGLYAITRDGKVWSHKYKKFMMPHKFRDKVWYYSISLWKNRVGSNFKIHRLVAQAYIPNPQNLAEVNHKNGIKNDNRVENLEWMSRKDNLAYGWKMIPMGIRNIRRGENSGKAKITEEIVRQIRKDYSIKDGMAKKSHKTSFRKLAKKYHMGKSNIEAIVTRRSWAHI